MSAPVLRAPLRLAAQASLLLLIATPLLSAQSAQSARSAQPGPAAPDLFALAKEAFLSNDLASATSLLDAAVRARPQDAERRAWLADAARRTTDATTALREAREALRLDPCHSFAHEVVASLHNPQFAHMELQSDDSTVAHLEQAVRCDAANGSAWMSLWVQSLRHDDRAAERRALEGLRTSGLLTPSWLAHGRWVLRTLPPRAIVLAAGDIDTYPPAVAQTVEGLRPDVALVNTSMLNIGYVVEHLVRRYGLALPPDLAGDVPRDTLDFNADRIIAFWRAEAAAGRLDRPLVVLHSMGFEYATTGAGTPMLSGPHWVIGASAATLDTAAVAAAYRLADATDLSGPFVSPQDRSPVRVSAAFSPALMLGYLAAYEAAARGAMPRERLPWLEAAFQRAGVAPAAAEPMLQWVRSFPVR